MFFGYETKPAFVNNTVKVKREPFVKCSPDKKCRGSMPVYKKCKCGNEVSFERFLYWDGSEDFGVTVTKCTAVIGQHTHCWFEDKETSHA
jgi:hypothetical protein